jgi:hypothetical protein
MMTVERQIDPEFEAKQSEAFKSKSSVALSFAVEVTNEALSSAVQKQFDRPLPVNAPLVELSARHPYDDATAARIDSYHPGRWDTESNLVFMSPIVQTGASVGEWDGTVIYAAFPNLASGVYLVSGVFSGYDITMSLFGPWGTTTAYNPTTNISSVVLAQASVDQGLFFSMNCKGSGLGYLSALQLFQQ